MMANDFHSSFDSAFGISHLAFRTRHLLALSTVSTPYEERNCGTGGIEEGKAAISPHR